MPSMEARPLEGKVALVTGASRGIGRVIALELGRLGASVAVNYHRRLEEAEKVVRELAELGSGGVAIQADVSDPEEAHRLVQLVNQELGGLDILINSAARGLERPRNAMQQLPQHIRNSFDLNVIGPWFCSKEAAPIMERRGGGAIVNLTSLGAKRYIEHYAAVGVTKGALDTLTMYLAAELAPKNIRVNGVCPSWVEETGGVAAMSPEVGEALRRNMPAGRHVSPQDVANLVAFLCLPESQMIVGQTIVLDGGVSLRGIVR